jgi:hypothetical protein
VEDEYEQVPTRHNESVETVFTINGRGGGGGGGEIWNVFRCRPHKKGIDSVAIGLLRNMNSQTRGIFIGKAPRPLTCHYITSA